MSKSRCRNAFTLIEVLIVVIIMAVLAATIIPQFTTSTKDAKQSSVKFNMHTMRSQIELYKAQHNGKYPALTDSTIPNLTIKTNADEGTTGDTPYGPYIDQIPTNPNNGLATVKAVTTAGTKPTAADNTVGWFYDVSNGAVWPADTDSYTTGGAMNP